MVWKLNNIKTYTEQENNDLEMWSYESKNSERDSHIKENEKLYFSRGSLNTALSFLVAEKKEQNMVSYGNFTSRFFFKKSIDFIKILQFIFCLIF